MSKVKTAVVSMKRLTLKRSPSGCRCPVRPPTRLARNPCAADRWVDSPPRPAGVDARLADAGSTEIRVTQMSARLRGTQQQQAFILPATQWRPKRPAQPSGQIHSSSRHIRPRLGLCR